MARWATNVPLAPTATKTATESGAASPFHLVFPPSKSMRLRFSSNKLMRAALLGIAAPFAFLAATCATQPFAGSGPDAQGRSKAFEEAHFEAHFALTSQASAEVQYLLAWIAATADNGQLDFVVIDKKNATAHVFSSAHTWRASSPVLIGLAVGDDTVPGIGDRPVSQVQSHERTTPAGRFMAELGTNTQGEAVVWVDYDAAVSMHSVRNTKPEEQRLQRLASEKVAERRISYGCINFPQAIFQAQVLPMFSQRKALVYVLPDVKSVNAVFGSSSVSRVAQAPKGP